LDDEISFIFINTQKLERRKEMSSALYDMTMELNSCDWLIPFGDQFQAWSSEDIGGEPLASDIEDKVVQDWSSAHAPKWCKLSAADVLHNSVSPHLHDGLGPTSAHWMSSSSQSRKERFPSGDEALKFVVSPGELLYQSVNENCEVAEELAQVVEDTLDVFGSELLITDCGSVFPSHITDLHFDEVAAFLSPTHDCLREAPISPSSQTDHTRQLFESQIHSFYVVSSTNQSEVSVVQQVPSSPIALLPLIQLDDGYDVYDESLTDPDTVCNLLQRLSKNPTKVNISTSHGHKLSDEPLLSPMSPEDIDSILSVRDDMTSSTSETDLLAMGEDYAQSELLTKSRDFSHSKLSSLPVTVIHAPESRKLKKKEQNKSAAHRYRQKKREEKGVVLSEVDQLQLRNSELKTRLEELNREIKYLKGLLDEIRNP